VYGLFLSAAAHPGSFRWPTQVHLAQAAAAQATNVTSELAHFIKARVRLLLAEIYRRPSSEARYARSLERRALVLRLFTTPC